MGNLLNKKCMLGTHFEVLLASIQAFLQLGSGIVLIPLMSL